MYPYGYDIRERNPFTEKIAWVFSGLERSPYVNRMRALWHEMREAVRDLMPAFFQCLRDEKEASVRIVLGHFFFVYIHPYMDGNGRIGRFLMNTMLASGGYPWTVISVERRAEYMASLEEASVKQNILPFCQFLASCVEKN